MTRRTWTCATCRIEHTCTQSLVSSFDSFITPHGSRPLALVFSPSSHPCTCVVILECFSPSPSTSSCCSSSSSLSWRLPHPHKIWNVLQRIQHVQILFNCWTNIICTSKCLALRFGPSCWMLALELLVSVQTSILNGRAVWCSRMCFTFNASMASESVESSDTVVCVRNHCRTVKHGPISRTTDVEQLIFGIHGHMDDIVQLSHPKKFSTHRWRPFEVTRESLQSWVAKHVALDELFQGKHGYDMVLLTNGEVTGVTNVCVSSSPGVSEVICLRERQTHCSTNTCWPTLRVLHIRTDEEIHLRVPSRIKILATQAVVQGTRKASEHWQEFSYDIILTTMLFPTERR